MVLVTSCLGLRIRAGLGEVLDSWEIYKGAGSYQGPQEQRDSVSLLKGQSSQLSVGLPITHQSTLELKSWNQGLEVRDRVKIAKPMASPYSTPSHPKCLFSLHHTLSETQGHA